MANQVDNNDVKNHVESSYKLGVGWYARSSWLLIIILFTIKFGYEDHKFSLINLQKMEWVIAFLILGAFCLVNLSETEFRLTNMALFVSKPLSLGLYKKRKFELTAINKVVCEYTTGITVQPRIIIFQKNGKRRSWLVFVSIKKVQSFLMALKDSGIETELIM